MSKNKDKKVFVTIKCKQVVHFEQQVEMSKEDFEKIQDINLDDVHEIRDKEQYLIIEQYLNPMDVLSVDDEFLDVQITRE